MSVIRAFLARAVPWPTADQPGWVDIHWTNRDPATGAFKGLSGYAFSDHVAASNHVFGMTRTDADLYVCMSLQAYAEAQSLSRAGKTRRRAMRSWDGALLLRSHWIDVDVKPGYFATTAEALLAFHAWRVKVGLPEPTFIVMTGSGGFHVHWVYDEAITRETWLPVAYALQQALKVEQFPCDYGVVVNPACILRIPGTKNHKLSPPGDVTLDQMLSFTYPFAFIDQQLAAYRVSYSLPVTTSAAGPKLAFKPNPKLAGLPAGPRLDAGIAAWVPTLDEVIAGGCLLLEAAKASGGAGYPEPLWAETLKLASFMVDGVEVAHELSNGHADYDGDVTDQKYERIAAVHGGGRIGWPQCRTINAAGATECTRCPHLVADRSPLNYAAPEAPASPPAQTPAPPPPLLASLTSALPLLRQPVASLHNFGYGDLPDGYQYTQDGTVQEEIEIEDAAGNKIKKWDTMFPNPIYDLEPHAKSTDGGGHYGISFRCQTDAIHLLRVVLRMSDVSEQRAFNLACSEQAGIASESMPRLRRLMLSFRDQLLAKKRSTTQSEAFGWSIEEGQSEPTGFCHGELRYTAAGPMPFVPIVPKAVKLYQPVGALAVWKQAAALIVDQQRYDLIAPIAASFGTPLIYLTGMAGVVMSIWSTASGIGKSHCLRVSQAVWGNPKTGMGALNDTSNFVNTMVVQLRHLPFFYDELRQETDTKKLIDIIFAMGQGKGKGRLTATAELRDVGSFATLLCVASNNSLMSYINEHVSTTAAGMNRVFEIEIRNVPNAPGRIDTTVAQSINGSLESNFGHAGAIYADFLGRNVASVKEATLRSVAAFNAALGASHDERFWIVTIAITLMGAKYANHLGLTQIDESRLAAFLIERFADNRRFRNSAPVDMEQASNTVRYLQDYINARRESTLTTDVLWQHMGKPPAGYRAVQKDANNDLTGKRICIRIGLVTKVLRVSRADFGRWLTKERNVQRDIVIEALIKTVGARYTKANLAAHTRYTMAREDVLEFDLANIPDLME